MQRMNEAVESLGGMIAEVQRTEEKCRGLEQQCEELKIEK
jgi:hypothetical protein